jgi:predicted PolB exonuclease-like 3'-5' exonuclease
VNRGKHQQIMLFFTLAFLELSSAEFPFKDAHLLNSEPFKLLNFKCKLEKKKMVNIRK